MIAEAPHFPALREPPAGDTVQSVLAARLVAGGVRVFLRAYGR